MWRGSHAKFDILFAKKLGIVPEKNKPMKPKKMGVDPFDKMKWHSAAIEQSYSFEPLAVRLCENTECYKQARGSEYCAYCHEMSLAEYVGALIAKDFHFINKEKRDIWTRMESIIESRICQ